MSVSLGTFLIDTFSRQKANIKLSSFVKIRNVPQNLPALLQ